jgi:S1-C subfamily serine protease
MARGLVINVVAGAERYTEVFTRDTIRVGNTDDCELQLTNNALNASVWLEISRHNGAYTARFLNHQRQFLYNGEPPAAEIYLNDGDQIEAPIAALMLQFFPVGGLPAVLPSLRGGGGLAAAERRDAVARSDEAKAFLRDFSRELLREISPATKLFLGLALAVLLLGSGYLLWSFYRELQRSRAASETAQGQVNDLKKQLEELNGKLESIGDKTGELVGSASLPYKVRNDYGNGVCLIYGLYYYVDQKTGKPLRFPQASDAMPMEGEEIRPYVVDGNGPVAEFEAIGTGFHVGEGFILTNRHVAQPWTEEQQAKQLKAMKASARMKRLIVYFPDRQQPLPLSFRISSSQEDVAVCHIDKLPEDVPILPLDNDAESVAVGRIVALIGYPNGPNRLIAILEEPEQQELQKRCGGTQGSLVGCLAEKKLIKPLTTQGTVTDKDVKRIVYDARTAEGGSGSPLFGQTGRVIGINFGIFADSEASNFAVPIRYGVNLLQRAGWGKKADTSNANTTANANSAPKNNFVSNTNTGR